MRARSAGMRAESGVLRHRAEQAAAAAAAAKREALAVAAQRDELQRVRLAGIWKQFKQTQRCSSLSRSSKSWPLPLPPSGRR